MTRLVRLETGEELTPAGFPALSAEPLRLRILEPAPPVLGSRVIHVAPLGDDRPRDRDVLLWRSGGGFGLGSPEGRSPDSLAEVLGRVVAVERGPEVFSLVRGPLARIPAPWLSRALDVLEVLRRFRHPFTPSIYLGSAENCLTGIREKYDREVEARQYARLAATGLQAFERQIVARHVKPGGRILDMGCGAGREALGFARDGFRVVGIDIAPRMIEAARANAQREGLDITFRVQSATDLDEPPGSFDAVYWAGSYQHVPGRALRVETLRRIARALTPDGVLILMVVYRAPRGLLSRSRLVDWLRAGANFFGAGRLSEPGDAYMRETSEASDPSQPCFFHDFSSPREVRAELEAAGLRAGEVSPGRWVCRPAVP